jgi:hypothetical protein
MSSRRKRPRTEADWLGTAIMIVLIAAVLLATAR